MGSSHSRHSANPLRGYRVLAAPPDAWRAYDPQEPEPGYFEFDWISARHPDLYHRFALSTVGLMEELGKLVDLTGLDVVDIGAGTGRATLAAAKTAKHVHATDAYRSVVKYGSNEVRKEGLTNVAYVQGDSAALPLRDRSVDAALCAWAEIDYREAYRVLKPGGWIVVMACAPGSLMGELTEVLSTAYPEFASQVAPRAWFDPDFPPQDTELEDGSWGGIPVQRVRVHDFTYVADYGDPNESASILGRIYGPAAARYMRDNGKPDLAWRLRISCGQVSK